MSTAIKSPARSAKVKPATKAVAKPKRAKRPAYSPTAMYFMVDGILPCHSWQESQFFADAIADMRNRDIEITRTIMIAGTPNRYVRRPRDTNARQQIRSCDDHIVIDGNRVIFQGRFEDAMAFKRGYGGGTMCHVHHVLTDEERKEKDREREKSLRVKAKLAGFNLVKAKA